MKKNLLLILFVLSCLFGNVNAQWQQSGLPTRQVNVLALSGTDIFAGCDSNVYRSVDNGMSWSTVTNGLPGDKGAMSIAISGANIFAVANAYMGTYVSINNGGLWTSIGGPNAPGRLVIRGTSIYGAHITNGILEASISVPTWTPFNTGLPHTCISGLGGSGDGIFAYVKDNFVCTPPAVGVFGRNSAAFSWTVNTLPSYNAFPVPWAMVSSGANIYAGGQGAVYLSTDTGATWATLNAGLPGDIVSALAISGTNMLAGHLGAGIYVSTNSGITWTNASLGLTDQDIRTLVIIGTDVFAGTATAGVWKRSIADILTSVKDVGNHIFLSVSPNPAQETIFIERNTANTSATLQLFDCFGKKVEEIKMAVGEKRSGMNVKSFAAGFYFVRMADEKEQVVRKVVVQR